MIGRVCDRVARVTAASMAAVFSFLAMNGSALAQMGKPAPGQIGLQDAATPVMEQIHVFHDLVTMIIVAIAVFVLILLAWVILRYNAPGSTQSHPVSRTTRRWRLPGPLFRSSYWW